MCLSQVGVLEGRAFKHIQIMEQQLIDAKAELAIQDAFQADLHPSNAKFAIAQLRRPTRKQPVLF